MRGLACEERAQEGFLTVGRNVGEHRLVRRAVGTLHVGHAQLRQTAEVFVVEEATERLVLAPAGIGLRVRDLPWQYALVDVLD